VRKLKKIKNNLVYWFAVSVIRLFNIIPRNMALFFGAVLGWAAFILIRKDRLKAQRHLALIYGNKLSPAERQLISRDVFINFGRNIADVVRFRKYYRSQIKSLVDIEGQGYFDDVYRRGKGVVAVTGHIGNFELLAVFFAEQGYKTAVIGRELYDSRLDRLLVDNRVSMELVNIDTQDSPRKILKVLKDGYAVGVLMDTDSMRVRSEFIPAFGRLSYTPVGQTILGLRAGAGFVPMACIRDGTKYKVIVRPEIVVKRTGDLDKDVYNITRKCTEALEKIIDEYKDQWIWIHNRWLTEPKETIY
jgi:KDO2-lipid IV(A) lauroyltransferase